MSEEDVGPWRRVRTVTSGPYQAFVVVSVAIVVISCIYLFTRPDQWPLWIAVLVADVIVGALVFRVAVRGGPRG